jgi:hypothetical protein
MEIKVEDYLSHEEIKQIVIAEVRQQAKSVLKSEEDVKRILSNNAYEAVYQLVDKTLDEDLVEHMRDKVVRIISGLSEYHLFKTPDAWSRDENSAYQLLKQIVHENKALLQERVVATIKTAPKSLFTEVVKLGLKEWVIQKLTS